MKFDVLEASGKYEYLEVELAFLSIARSNTGEDGIGLHFEADGELLSPIVLSPQEAICLRDGLNKALLSLNSEEQN